MGVKHKPNNNLGLRYMNGVEDFRVKAQGVSNPESTSQKFDKINKVWKRSQSFNIIGVLYMLG